MTTQFLLANAVFQILVDPIKPILMLLPIIPWAWLVSSKLDKDAMYFHLNRRMWNGIFMSCLGAAILAMLLIPIFWIGWPVGMIVLLTPVLVYWKIRNDTVPESKKFYLTMEKISAALAERRSKAAARGTVLTFFKGGGEPWPVPDKEDPALAVYLGLEDLLGPAIESRASRVDLIPSANGYLSVQTIDSIKYRRNPLAPDVANRIIDYIKAIAGMDVEDRRRRQSGSVKVSGPNGSNVITIKTAGSSAGQELRLDIDLEKQVSVPFDALGFMPQQLEALKPLKEGEHRHGVVLVGAPSGHGLTTTMLSLIGRHDAYTQIIKTLEREFVTRLEGVDHVVFDATSGELDYATNLQSILRRDPDIVMASDLLADGTAAVAAAPGMEGPLIYIGQPRMNSVKEQIVDWVKRVGDVKKAVGSLTAVINGRLVRQVCPNCRQPYQPGPDVIKKLGLPANVKQLHKAGGKVQVKNKIEECPVCRGVGYFGVTGIYEVMVIDQTARKLLLGNDLQGAYTHCRSKKMVFLQEAGLAKVIEGRTTLDEVVRVTAPPAKSSSGSAGKPKAASASS